MKKRMAFQLVVGAVLLVGLLGLVLMAVSPPAGAQSKKVSVDKLTIRYGNIPDAQLVAHQLGWFEQELGIPINWITISGGAATIAAMQSGSLDIGCGVGTPPIAAASAQGVPLRIFWIQDNAAESLAVRPSAAKSVKELAGKKIGALVGSTMYFALVVALQKEGVNIRDVKIIDLPIEETVAAFRRGDIDGALLPHPMVDQIIEGGAVEIMSPEVRTKKYGYSLFDACVVMESFAKKHPDVLEKWVEVEDRAIKFSKERPKDAYEAIAKNLSISVEMAKKGFEEMFHPTAAEQVTPDWLGLPGSKDSGVAKAIKITAEFQKSLGRIPDVPKDVDSLIDARFVAKVAGK